MVTINTDNRPGVPSRENGWAIVLLGHFQTHCLQGKLCIEVKSSDKIAFISEFLCIGCGICVKKCVTYQCNESSITQLQLGALLKLLPSSTYPPTWNLK